MAYFFVLLQFSLLVSAFTIAKPAEEERKSRVLSNELSDEDHYFTDGHNPEYDHEAFLGEEEARTFDELPPEESKRRLGIIIDKIDKDNDGFVTHDELKAWIEHTQKKYILDDIQKQWESHNPLNTSTLKWEDYRKIVYGFLDSINKADLEKDEESMTYQSMVDRDKKRWEVADSDKDGALSLKEFGDFLHPEEAEHMRDVVVAETIEDIDKDKDGRISLEEYIGDMYKESEDGESEPAWVVTEREHFVQYRDANKDGYMDEEEVRAWIIPPEYDHADAEAVHLIREADEDLDKRLSIDEILDQYDLFVGSQATDFGEALIRHDEF